jgi:Zn-dependent peptidase ImmA (M78 family)
MVDRHGCVCRRTKKQIEDLAKAVRRELGVEPSSRISMLPILEFAIGDMVEDAYMDVANDSDMPGAEGQTDQHRPVITLSASCHAALRRGNARARMTAAHELGHLLMHTRQPVFFYRSQTRDRRRDPEWQADIFAATLLMPASGFRKMRTVSQAMRVFGVSRPAALRRARDLNIQMIDDKVRGSGRVKKGHGMNRAP